MATIYKICRVSEWEDAVRDGVFSGSASDLRDGFIHFSTAEQVAATAAKHFAGVSDLVLVAVDDAILGPALRYEAARAGELFPHLYARLDPTAALWVKPLPLDPGGRHVIPDLTP